MKIKYLELKDHPVLGNLKLELFDDEGKVYNTIVFVGENGVGKTSILMEISSLAKGVGDENYLSKIVFELNKKETTALCDDGLGNILSLSKNRQVGIPNNMYLASIGNRNFNYSTNNYSMEPADKLLHRIVVKIRRNDAEPVLNKIRGVSNNDVDETVSPQSLKRIVDLNTDLDVAQLLVDLSVKDAVEFRNSFNKTGILDEALMNKRIGRFKNSFNTFFDNKLRFDEVSETYDVNFTKDGRVFDATKLSSGEKTIVQSGAALLKDIYSDETPIVLIDEPEQALHPKWQEHILDYYQNILSINPDKDNQLFVTTHSEHVLKEALQKNNVLIIALRREQEGKIKYEKIQNNICVLPYISYDEIKYKIFGIVSSDYHDDLLGFIQECTLFGCKKQDEEFQLDNRCRRIHWNGYDKGERREQLDCETLPFYIRNYYHHPELRQYNEIKVDDNMLRESINYLELKIKEITQSETV